MNSLQGHLLVASPHLLDPNFARTVVLLIQHTHEGAFGVVLNRPTDSTIQEIWSQVGEGDCQDERHVNLGGPVSGPLLALHDNAAISELEVLPGVYFAAQRENLQKLVGKEDNAYRLFVGHSGWGGGQLERELEEGSWLTLPASAEYVFYDDGDLWRRVSQTIGQSFFTSVLKIKHVPPDPAAN
jgi:putative transcriptional regulator